MVFPTIETARLKLLPAENGRDLPTYMSHLDSSGEFFIQYGYHDSPELREAIELQCAEDIIRYSMFAKDTGEMVGYVGITPYEHESMSGNLEFHVFREFRRQRYAMEAVTAFLDAFFTGSLTTIAGETTALSKCHGAIRRECDCSLPQLQHSNRRGDQSAKADWLTIARKASWLVRAVAFS